MSTVALVGADGAGKTSVARRLEREGPLAIKYLYMGVNPEAGDHLLPTTRAVLLVKRILGKETRAGGPPDPSRRRPPSRRWAARASSAVKAGLRTANLLGEEWYRQCLAWYYQLRGYTVLFDRHFHSDYYAHDIAPDSSRRGLSRRFHGFVLDRLYPKPDLVILLDAPARVLFERKQEGTVELIERRRQEYFLLRDRVPRFAIVNAEQPIDAVARDVAEAILASLPASPRRR